MPNRKTAKVRRSVLEAIPSARRAPTQVNTTAPAAPATAARTSSRACWLYLRTAMTMVGSTMMSAVPCANCCDMPIRSTSAGIAISPPPMPSTPPRNPINAPLPRQAATTRPLKTALPTLLCAAGDIAWRVGAL